MELSKWMKQAGGLTQVDGTCNDVQHGGWCSRRLETRDNANGFNSDVRAGKVRQGAAGNPQTAQDAQQAASNARDATVQL